jgi:hypothetical protein
LPLVVIERDYYYTKDEITINLRLPLILLHKMSQRLP